METSPFGPSTTWWRSRKYQVIDGCFIAPADDCRWPDDFREYDPLQDYYSDSSTGPHIDLMNLASYSVADVLGFIRKWGMLGTALRYDYLGIKDFRAETWGSHRVFSRYFLDSEGYMEGERYFERCFKRPPREVPFGYGSLREVYGEWVDTGPELTGNPRADAHEALWHSGVAYFHQTFTDHARQFQDSCQALYRGETGEMGFPDWGRDTKAFPQLVWVDGAPRMGFRFSSLLDACYLMVMLDQQKGVIRKCPECGQFWRQTEKTRRTRLFCPSKDEPNYDEWQSGPPSRSCTRRAHNRKSDQRFSWDCFLQAEAPDLKTLLESVHGKVKHPYDMLGDMSPEVRLLARQWAEQVARKSDRKYDMWLEPFLRRDD